MKGFARSLLGVAFVVVAVGASSAKAADSAVDGRWDATLTIDKTVIPFRLDISGEGANLTGTLYNGDEKQTTTSARLENGSVVLNFEHYLTKIVATVKDGRLDGKVEGRFERDRYITEYPFHAEHYSRRALSSKNVPSIDGLWEIQYESAKGEKAW